MMILEKKTTQNVLHLLRTKVAPDAPTSNQKKKTKKIGITQNSVMGYVCNSHQYK